MEGTFAPADKKTSSARLGHHLLGSCPVHITGLWYGVEDGYLRNELDDGSVLLVAASWEGVHVMMEDCETAATPATV